MGVCTWRAYIYILYIHIEYILLQKGIIIAIIIIINSIGMSIGLSAVVVVVVVLLLPLLPLLLFVVMMMMMMANKNG